VELYANTVIDLLNNPDIIKGLRKGCEATRELYSLDKMVNRFFEGIKSTLSEIDKKR
jgi:hypothetical protein